MQDVTTNREACPKCRTALGRDARFCHACGLPLGGSRRRAGAGFIGWTAAGAATVALVMVVVMRMGSPGQPPAQPALRPPAAPDISQMTPRERADRLFDRIVDAAERGDTAEIARFQPMAIAAYDLLAERDADARYHMGVIHTLVGNSGGARAQLDTLRSAAPSHLLGLMLDYTIARVEGDTPAQRRLYRRFADAYDAEIAKPQPEYQAHAAAIDAFLTAARRALSESN
jgi:predicted nucleic acid-binding Zn ribbon protein